MIAGFGPLQYRLLAHDAWGMQAVGALKVFQVEGLPQEALRQVDAIHLLELELTDTVCEAIRKEALPPELSRLVRDALPQNGWKFNDDGFGCLTAIHDDCPHAVMAHVDRQVAGTVTAWLPWQIIFRSIRRRGGAIMHGGLAQFEDRTVIFTAPGGGGKTTSLCRLPASWRVLCDDGCLVWPAYRGWFASPLPTWSALRGFKSGAVPLERMKCSEANKLDAIMRISKSDDNSILKLAGLQARIEIYRALREHPVNLHADAEAPREQFLAADKLSSSVGCNQLNICLRKEFWTMLQAYLKRTL